MMDDASLSVFNALSRYSDLEDLIANGEEEGLHLECKAISVPRIEKNVKKNSGAGRFRFLKYCGRSDSLGHQYNPT